MNMYLFEQNSNYGRLKAPGQLVVIWADSAQAANQIAVENGIYFDGVARGIDCRCCDGSRWHRVTEADRIDCLPLIEEYDEYDEADPFCRVVVIEKERP